MWSHSRTRRLDAVRSSFDDGRREFSADQPANWLISSRFRAGRRCGRVNVCANCGSDRYRVQMGVGWVISHPWSSPPRHGRRVSRLCCQPAVLFQHPPVLNFCVKSNFGFNRIRLPIFQPFSGLLMFTVVYDKIQRWYKKMSSCFWLFTCCWHR